MIGCHSTFVTSDLDSHSKKHLMRSQQLEETPTYLEVPHFQRVAITGDYAAGVRLYLPTSGSDNKK